MPAENNHCERCEYIRALPDSPTRRDMTLDHLLDLGHQARPVNVKQTVELLDEAITTQHRGAGETYWREETSKRRKELLTQAVSCLAQARPVEAPKGELTFEGSFIPDEPYWEPKRESDINAHWICVCGRRSPEWDSTCFDCRNSAPPKPEPAKPPESEALAYAHHLRNHGDILLKESWDKLISLIEADATRSFKPALTKPPESETLSRFDTLWKDGQWNPDTDLIPVKGRKLTLLRCAILADAQRLKEAHDRLVALDHSLADSMEELIGMKDKLIDAQERAEKAERERDGVREEYHRIDDELTRERREKEAAMSKRDNAERERDAARQGMANEEYRVRGFIEDNNTMRRELAAVKDRLAQIALDDQAREAGIISLSEFVGRVHEACAKAEAGEQMENNTDHQLRKENRELRADRAKWVKVCAERDESIVKLRDELGVFLNLPYAAQKQAVAHRRELVQRIKDYASQHTQYPFANAIIDLCNQVLEPK